VNIYFHQDKNNLNYRNFFKVLTGGQFTPKWGGQFAPKCTGHFVPK